MIYSQFIIIYYLFHSIWLDRSKNSKSSQFIIINIVSKTMKFEFIYPEFAKLKFHCFNNEKTKKKKEKKYTKKLL